MDSIPRDSSPFFTTNCGNMFSQPANSRKSKFEDGKLLLCNPPCVAGHCKMAGNCHPHTVKNPFRPAIHGYIPLSLHDISVELVNKNILRLPRCDDPNLRHLGEHMYRMIPASCGSTPAKANLQSLLLEKLSLENLDWLSSF